MQGKVKFFNRNKGYGFIAPLSGGGQDIFVHASALPVGMDLFEHDLVQYELGTDPRTGRTRADRVRVLV